MTKNSSSQMCTDTGSDEKKKCRHDIKVTYEMKSTFSNYIAHTFSNLAQQQTP